MVLRSSNGCYAAYLLIPSVPWYADGVTPTRTKGRAAPGTPKMSRNRSLWLPPHLDCLGGGRIMAAALGQPLIDIGVDHEYAKRS